MIPRDSRRFPAFPRLSRRFPAFPGASQRCPAPHGAGGSVSGRKLSMFTLVPPLLTLAWRHTILEHKIAQQIVEMAGRFIRICRMGKSLRYWS